VPADSRRQTQEVDGALAAHGLVKIRMLADDREAREVALADLADRLNAAPVQHIGRLLVLWRPVATKPKTMSDDRHPGPRLVKIVKFSKRPGRRPEVKIARVLGNQRVAAGGTIKRAKPRQVSLKKKSAG
jgi:RNA-binding protein YhbY